MEGQAVTYHAGLFGSEPYITCDGCGVVRHVTARGGIPAEWFITGKAAPGWAMWRDANDLRRDECKACKTGRAKP